MSRVCVKGLPPNATEAQVRAHFAGLGDVTDVKIARTKAGASRQFAFVGFKQAEAGGAAVARLHRSFLGTSRLHVEAARDVGDVATLQTARSRHTKFKLAATGAGGAARGAAPTGASAASATAQTDAAAAVPATAGVKDARKLQEYLALQARKPAASAVWANDDAVSSKAAAEGAMVPRRRAAAAAEASRKADDDDGASTDSEDYQELPGGEEEPAAPAGAAGGDEDSDADCDDDADVAPKNPAASDLDFLRAHVVKGRFSDEEGDEEKVEDAGGVHSGSESSDNEEDGDAASPPKAKRRQAAKPTAAAARSKGSAAVVEVDAEDDEGSGGGAMDVDAAPASTDAAPAADADEATAADVGESGRLFVRNLPFSATEEEVAAFFSQWGALAEGVKMPRAPAGTATAAGGGGRHRGFALVTYVLPEAAVTALAAADGRVFQGRLLHVLPARPPPPAKEEAEDGSGGRSAADGKPASSYQAAAERERRAAAVKAGAADGGATSAWSTLFVRGDAAVTAVAARLGVSASALLDRDAANLAVRVALAETQVVAETKAWLTGEGVDVSVLERGLVASTSASSAGGGKAAPTSATVKRSDCAILVKNLPADADAGALRELFGRHGALTRLVMPPSRALALVEFAAPAAAKKAFAACAYARFQRVPLYLEWAPEAVFTAPAPAAAAVEAAPAPAAASAAPTAAAAAASSSAAAPASASAPAAAALSGGRTLFVKNLAWATTEEGLRDMFAASSTATGATGSGVRSVTIPRRRNPKFKLAPGGGKAVGNGEPEWLSLGYGFVEFGTAEEAGRALRALQGRTLDGHALTLKVAGAGDGEDGAAATTTAGKRAAAAAKKAPAAAAAAAATPSSSSSSTKLIVRNLAFEATRKDVQELFAPFGALKSVRLPKKFDGSHRGFAFVEFLTREEAAAAATALAATHLYGRHLVLEWAAGGGDEGGSGAGVGAGTSAASTATAAAAVAGSKKKQTAVATVSGSSLAAEAGLGGGDDGATANAVAGRKRKAEAGGGGSGSGAAPGGGKKAKR